MTSVIPARRRAEEFAGLVDTGHAGDSRYAELLDLVGDLRGITPPTPRADYVEELRARLMAEADEALVAVDHRLALPTHPRTRRDRRVAIAATAIVAIGATSSVAVAAQNALPGDTLYPIKRVIESARTTLQTDDGARAEQLLDNASGRLDEAREIARRDSAEAELPQTLDTFTSQARSAADLLLVEYARTGDPEPIHRLRSFAAASMDQLAGLDALVPAALRDELNAAALELAQIDARAQDACPACGGGITEWPSVFLTAAETAARLPGAEPQPGQQLDQVVDREAVEELIGALDAVQRDGEVTPAPVEATPTPAPAPVGEGEEDSSRPVRRVTDELLGTGDDEEAGAVERLLEGPLLGPVTGEGGLLDP
jgi:hypothetical protein